MADSDSSFNTKKKKSPKTPKVPVRTSRRSRGYGRNTRRARVRDPINKGPDPAEHPKTRTSKAEMDECSHWWKMIRSKNGMLSASVFGANIELIIPVILHQWPELTVSHRCDYTPGPSSSKDVVQPLWSSRDKILLLPLEDQVCDRNISNDGTGLQVTVDNGNRFFERRCFLLKILWPKSKLPLLHFLKNMFRNKIRPGFLKQSTSRLGLQVHRIATPQSATSFPGRLSRFVSQFQWT